MKKILFHCAFFFLTLFFIPLFLCETGYRTFLAVQKPLMRPSSVPDLGWEGSPGAHRLVISPQGRKIDYWMNQKGFRDSNNGPWEIWKKEDRKILFLGDSVTEGADVLWEEAYPAQVEKILNRSEEKARVVNWGVSATNSVQHLALLKYKALALGPDLVVLGYCLNDIETRFIEKRPWVVRKIWENLYFVQFLAYRLSSWLQNREFHHAKDARVVEAAVSDYQERILELYRPDIWQGAENTLKRMNEMCRAKGVPFAVVLFPFQKQVTGELGDSVQRQIGDFLDRENIPSLDILKVFKSRSEDALYLQGDPIHLSPLGHRVAAEAIAGFLGKRKSVLSDQ